MSDTTNQILADEIGDAHESFTALTPLREDAFDLSNEEKIATIAEHVKGSETLVCIANFVGENLVSSVRHFFCQSF